ncbi:hypothetical protein WA577_007635 [Blastocystis sp. JDR]
MSTAYMEKKGEEEDYLPQNDEFIPPTNFAVIENGLYRSAFPVKRNFAFLRHLGIRSILVLVPEEYPEDSLKFLKRCNIRLFKYPLEGNKEPFTEIPKEMVVDMMNIILDTRNLPLLIHCNSGKHRTGSVVGCIRRIQGWSLSSILWEYRLYAEPKPRFMDQQYIELFDINAIHPDRRYLPDWPGILE